MKNHRKVSNKTALVLTATLLLGGCAGGSLTTREKSVGVGGLGGAKIDRQRYEMERLQRERGEY